MRRYADRYQEIFEDNRRLMEFLHEIDSPIPEPLRVAADVTLTRRLLAGTQAAREGALEMDAAEAELEELAELAERMGAHLHNRAILRELGAMIDATVAELSGGKPPARPAVMLTRLVGLARRLGIELDLWTAQNQLWAWAGAVRVTIDHEVAAALARAFWFDETTWLGRAGYPA
jgi:hypothetical protein